MSIVTLHYKSRPERPFRCMCSLCISTNIARLLDLPRLPNVHRVSANIIQVDLPEDTCLSAETKLKREFE